MGRAAAWLPYFRGEDKEGRGRSMRHRSRQWLALLVLGTLAAGSVMLAAHAGSAQSPAAHPHQDTRAPAGLLIATPTATPCVFGLDPWRAEPPMNAARSWSGGAVVNNMFYVVGGLNGIDFSTAVERFDPASGAWTILALIPVPLSQARVAAIGTKIYVA